MPNLNITNIPAPRVPFIDERTGLMAREWYRFFLNLFVLTGSGNNPVSLEELQIGPPNQPDLAELLIQINQNIAPQYEDQSGDFLATLDTAQLMSMMSRFENAEAAIQGAYLQPVVQTGTIANYNLDGSPTAGGVAYGTGPALAVSAAGTLGQVLTSGGAGAPTWATDAGGTVTTVGFTGGIITVANPTTTPAFTIAGTSGGVPYFSSASTWATSAALAAGALVQGGGAGVAPSTITTGTGVVTALGVNTGTAGAFVVNGGALGTPSSGTVTNLTGTASININGTVGATTPAAGAFTTLSATDVSTFAAGAVTLPSITTTGDTNTGVYFPAADTVGITTGGAQRGEFSSTGLAIRGTATVGSVVASPWGTNYPAIQAGGNSAGLAIASANINPIILYGNAYATNIQETYTTTGAAAKYECGGASGEHIFYTAPSGSAGAAIPFAEQVRIPHTASATRYITLTGSNGGNPTIGTSAGSLAVSTSLAVAGTLSATGVVTFSNYGAGAATFDAAGVISSVSDETWKTKDGVPTDPDAMLKKLEPGYWYYNDEKKKTFGADRQLGFYAQNVNAAIGPEAAPEPEEGKPWGYYDRSVLAITVMSLQKALATIEKLSARLEAK